MTPASRSWRIAPGLRPLFFPSLLVMVLTISIGSGCAPDPGEAPSDWIWHSTDLLFDRPVILDPESESLEPGVEADSVADVGFGYLGRKPNRGGDGRPIPPASQIGGLLQKTDTVLVMQIELGRQSSFRFRPMGGPGGPCHCLYRVWATAASSGPGTASQKAPLPENVNPSIGQFMERPSDFLPPVALLEVSPYRETDTAPDYAVVDLSAFDGRSTWLFFEIVPTGTGRWRKAPAAMWGSPKVLFRGPARYPEPGERPTREAEPASPPSIVMIGADTLRARALGTWGHEPSVSPALDRLAQNSEVWLNAYSAFNSTNPSFTSVHTGLYGKSHGVYDHSTFMPRDRPTLARQLSAAGYDTFAAFAARHLASAGLASDFDTFYKPERTTAAEYIVDYALDRIDDLRRTEQPFFAFLHMFDPHIPHTPPEPFAHGQTPVRSYGNAPVSDWTTWREPGPVEFESDRVRGGANVLYHDEVAYMDRQIDRLLGTLEQWGLLDNTIVVFFADHGENLDEHGLRFRHVGLWETTTHVPLMIRWPNTWRVKDAWQHRFAARHEVLVQTIDLFPTLLQVANAEVPGGIDARSLLAEGGRKEVFFEHANRRGQGIRTEDHLLIEIHDQPDTENGTFLYDLAKDPGEIDNVLLSQPDTARELKQRLSAWFASREDVEAERRPMTDEERRQLEALGYVDG